MSLELKRLKVELMRVTTARNELELKIEERLEDIDRIKQHITIQKTRETELTDKIKELENG